MPTPMRVLIAEDEKLARHRLERLLSSMEGVTVVASCPDGARAAAALSDETLEVDLALLDIQMPELSGLDVAGLVGDSGPLVIFVTAHDEHALAAYDVGVVDYVLKPVEASRLRRALDRARQLLADRPAPLPRRLALDVRGEVLLVDLEKITHATFDGELTTVHAVGHGPVLCDMSLSQLEEKVDGRLERVHRRALVRLDRIVRLSPIPSGGYVAHVVGGGQVPVSRAAARTMRKQLQI